MRVGWDATHGEFIVDDYYYFSKLRTLVDSEVDCVYSFYKLENYDVIVFNYPEVKFKLREISRIKSWLKKGKTVVFASYYYNLDNVTGIINSVLKKLGLEMRISSDVIVDEKNNDGDKMHPLAKYGDHVVVMPCSSSVVGGRAFVEGFTSAECNNGSKCFAAYEEFGRGKVIVLGTCVFWDNYSIEKYDNRILANDILNGKI